jgi:hypothetical protein
VVAEGEFTSVTLPFLAHADRGVQVTEVPPEDLAQSLGDAGSSPSAPSSRRTGG